MTTELLWFVLGIMASLVAGPCVWIIYLIAKTQRQKKQIAELMYDKGSLTMRISILEEALKETGR